MNMEPEEGIDYKICVLQVLSASKQTPPPATPFAIEGEDTYWVQTTMQLHEDGSLPFSELPGMFPRLYTFDKFWEIPRRQEGQQLKGVTLGVAQYVVGTFELENKKKTATMKTYVENEHISALVEHLYSVKHGDFNNLPFHTRGFVRTVPKHHWAAMFILASIMDTDLQLGCDQHGFVWVRTCICDLKRPNPAFRETTIHILNQES